MRYVNLLDPQVDVLEALPGFRQLLLRIGIEVPSRPDEEFFQQLHRRFGGSKLFANNAQRIAGQLPLDLNGVPTADVLDLLERTTMLEASSAHCVAGHGELEGEYHVLALGATANWMSRRVALIRHEYNNNYSFKIAGSIAVLASDRLVNSPLELSNSYVKTWVELYGYEPNESELMRFILASAGQPVGRAYVGLNLAQNAERFASDKANSDMFEGGAKFFLPLQAGSYAALDVRQAFRKVWPNFDQRGDQLVWSYDGIPLARTAEQMRDGANFQSPITMVNAIVPLVHAFFKAQHAPSPGNTAFNG